MRSSTPIFSEMSIEGRNKSTAWPPVLRSVGARSTTVTVRPRPAAPSRNRTDPQVPLYIRPNGGEDQALNRIVDWVNAIITDGHPGRREASRSEIVAAALAAEYLASSKR